MENPSPLAYCPITRAVHGRCRYRFTVPDRFRLERIPVRSPHLYRPFTVSSFVAALVFVATTITALTPPGRIGFPLPYSVLTFRDFPKVSLGHLVLFFRCSPCLNTYVQSHCVFRVLIAVCFPLNETRLNHLMKTHPLNTPPRPNPLHADALQRKTGRNPRSQALPPAASQRTG